MGGPIRQPAFAMILRKRGRGSLERRALQEEKRRRRKTDLPADVPVDGGPLGASSPPGRCRRLFDRLEKYFLGGKKPTQEMEKDRV